MNKLWLLLVFVSVVSLKGMDAGKEIDAGKLNNQQKNQKKGVVPSRRKKRKPSPAILTISDDSEERDDDFKNNLELISALQQASEKGIDKNILLQNILLSKNNYLERYMRILERDANMKEKVVNFAIEKAKTSSREVSMTLDEVVVSFGKAPKKEPNLSYFS